MLSELLVGGCGLGGLQNLGVECGWYSVHLLQGLGVEGLQPVEVVL